MAVEVPPDAPTYRLRRVWLDTNEIKGGYQGYANQVLWPLCHLTLDRVAYRKIFWHAYQAMNARFARQPYWMSCSEQARLRLGPRFSPGAAARPHQGVAADSADRDLLAHAVAGPDALSYPAPSVAN